MVDYAQALWMPVPAANVFNGYWGNTPKWVVVHKTASAGTAQDIAEFFINKTNRSTHYIVGQDGTVVQCVSESDGAGGNCCTDPGHAPFLPDADGVNFNLNWETISIEHCDPDPNNSTPLTPEQKTASFSLIKDICRRHNIPFRRGDASGGIIGHCDIAPVQKALCPNNYPWEELFAMNINTTLPVVANFFTSSPDNKTWTCKSNGFTMHGEILAFYSNDAQGTFAGLTDLGLPLGNEVALDTQGNVYQDFERGRLNFDPGHVHDFPPGAGRVYKAHVPAAPSQAALRQELLAEAKLIGDTSAQIMTTVSQQLL